MDILKIGLAVFIGIHLVPMIAPLKSALQKRLGTKGYKGGFALIALSGFGLIIWGMIAAPNVQVFEAPTWAKPAAFALVPIALILMAAANMKGRIRAVLRHPMMLGTLLWAGLHYAANGDRAGIWLFGSFIVFSVLSLTVSFVSGAKPDFVVKPKHDFMAIGGGIAVAVVFAFLHPVLFGVQLF